MWIQSPTAFLPFTHLQEHEVMFRWLEHGRPASSAANDAMECKENQTAATGTIGTKTEASARRAEPGQLLPFGE